jgi:hypothetical protein
MFIPLNVARQRLGKYVPGAKNTSNNRRNIERDVFYVVRVLSKDILWVFFVFQLGRKISP